SVVRFWEASGGFGQGFFEALAAGSFGASAQVFLRQKGGELFCQGQRHQVINGGVLAVGELTNGMVQRIRQTKTNGAHVYLLSDLRIPSAKRFGRRNALQDENRAY